MKTTKACLYTARRFEFLHNVISYNSKPVWIVCLQQNNVYITPFYSNNVLYIESSLSTGKEMYWLPFIIKEGAQPYYRRFYDYITKLNSSKISSKTHNTR